MLDTKQRSGGSPNLDTSLYGLDASSIAAIETANGWTNVSNCQFTQFAVGQPHSPWTPSKLYAALQYKDENGREVITPLSQVISFSQQNVGQRQR